MCTQILAGGWAPLRAAVPLLMAGGLAALRTVF